MVPYTFFLITNTGGRETTPTSSLPVTPEFFLGVTSSNSNYIRPSVILSWLVHSILRHMSLVSSRLVLVLFSVVRDSVFLVRPDRRSRNPLSIECRDLELHITSVVFELTENRGGSREGRKVVKGRWFCIFLPVMSFKYCLSVSVVRRECVGGTFLDGRRTSLLRPIGVSVGRPLESNLELLTPVSQSLRRYTEDDFWRGDYIFFTSWPKCVWIFRWTEWI